MKKLGLFLVVMMMSTSILLLAGCSKKPAPQPVTPPPPVTPRETIPAAEQKPVERAPEVRAAMELKDVFFDYDKYELKPDARDALTLDAQQLMANSQLRIVIEGHCDERGTNEYNLALGDRRARAAMDFLVRFGVAADRIETVSYGEERPFAPGHDESAWAQNRRVHFVVRS